MRTEAFYILYALGDFTNLVEGVAPIIAEGGSKRSTYALYLLGWSAPTKVIVVDGASPSETRYVCVFPGCGEGYRLMDLIPSTNKPLFHVVMRENQRHLPGTEKYISAKRDPRISREGGPGEMPLFGLWIIKQSEDHRIPHYARVQLIPLENEPIQGALVRLDGHTLEEDTDILLWNECPNKSSPSLTMHLLMPEGTSCIVTQKNTRMRLTMRDGTLICVEVVLTP
ncbi:hypothetical protein KBB27_01705 [Patescibacteria group bacterium]|nr:hypothetical protein [Patescibacteria group bacterium]